MGLFNSLFGGSINKEHIKEMVKRGATIVDVRMPQEFQGGHVAGSVNIPLQDIQQRIEEFKTLKAPIVLCCISGARSGQAQSILKQHGIETANGGGWMDVNGMLS